MSELFSVKGKRVLITGGTSGMGLAGAKHLAEQGADVIISGRRDAGQQAAEGIGARFIQCDVSGLEVGEFVTRRHAPKFQREGVSRKQPLRVAARATRVSYASSTRPGSGKAKRGRRSLALIGTLDKPCQSHAASNCYSSSASAPNC